MQGSCRRSCSRAAAAAKVVRAFGVRPPTLLRTTCCRALAQGHMVRNGWHMLNLGLVCLVCMADLRCPLRKTTSTTSAAASMAERAPHALSRQCSHARLHGHGAWGGTAWGTDIAGSGLTSLPTDDNAPLSAEDNKEDEKDLDDDGDEEEIWCRPCIILVEPTMGENIGAAARAMKNFGLADLRLVAPKDGWPNRLADACASNAQDLIRSARVYPTLDEAIADLNYLYAATARPRYMNKDYVLSRNLYQDYPRSTPPSSPLLHPQGGGYDTGTRTGSDSTVATSRAGPFIQPRVGIMFGRENNGLSNSELARADKIVTIDANPEYPVLNLAQSVVIITSTLYNEASRRRAHSPSAPNADAEEGQLQAGGSNSDGESGKTFDSSQQLATKGDLENFLSALDSDLVASGFFAGQDDKKQESVRVNIRNLFSRIPRLSAREVASLRGMLKKLNK